jgi:hypothetical protein
MSFTAQTAATLLRVRAAFRRALPVLAGTALLLASLTAPGGPAPAAGSGLKIELNKVEDNEGACLASLVVQNGLGHTLDRFSMDLYVFDSDGVIARQVLLDLAPLRGDKTTVARFSLIKRPCAQVSRILVNDIPSCRSEGTGETLDCLAGLSVSSRGLIEMVK